MPFIEVLYRTETRRRARMGLRVSRQLIGSLHAPDCPACPECPECPPATTIYVYPSFPENVMFERAVGETLTITFAVDLTAATGVELWAKSPDGDVVELTPVVVSDAALGEVEYDTTGDEFTSPGLWRLQLQYTSAGVTTRTYPQNLIVEPIL